MNTKYTVDANWDFKTLANKMRQVYTLLNNKDQQHFIKYVDNKLLIDIIHNIHDFENLTGLSVEYMEDSINSTTKLAKQKVLKRFLEGGALKLRGEEVLFNLTLLPVICEILITKFTPKQIMQANPECFI